MSGKLGGKVMVIGSINMDYIIHSVFPSPGQTVIGAKFSKRAGGKGANQAVAASKITENVSFVGALADDSEGAELRSILEYRKINIENLTRIENGTNSGVAFVTVDPNGENSIVVIPGANLELTFEQVKSAIFQLKPEVIVLQAEINFDVLNEILISEEIKLRRIFNLAPFHKFEKSVLASCNPLIVNEQEARELLGFEIGNNFERAANVILEIARSAIITLGANGVIVCDEGTFKHFEALEIDQVRDTTGAGDGFVGSLAGYLASGYSIHDATKKAIIFAGIAVSRDGGLDSYPEIDELK